MLLELLFELAFGRNREDHVGGMRSLHLTSGELVLFVFVHPRNANSNQLSHTRVANSCGGGVLSGKAHETVLRSAAAASAREATVVVASKI